MPPTINLNRKVGDILADIRANSPTERAKGDKNEKMDYGFGTPFP